ncbi:hypothetical protein [Streptomyces sp. NPDC051014]|uniref:hypothetical protein n=1 Tax=Streptomyces TaxID=1883 RepID=UPI0033F55018
MERVYRRRNRLPGRYFLAVGLPLLVAFGHLWTAGAEARRWGSLEIGLLVLLALVMLPLNQYRAHTRVTVRGITAQWALRARTWAWHEVYAIRAEPVPGRNAGASYPDLIVYLYDFRGRRFPLPQVNSWQLADAHAEAAGLRLAADPYRGLGWERRPDVEERIVRGIARRKVWGTVTVLAVVAVLLAPLAAVALG